MTEIEHDVLSTKAIVTAAIAALAIAGIALLVAVLPAEYGIDPTGLGAKLGLTALNNPRPQVAEPAASEATAFSEDTVTIELAVGATLEYKFHLKQYQAMKYSWTADNGSVFFDFHGEPDGDTSGFFESYAVSTADKVRGTFTAPFAGSHGWYWKNKGESAITITLTTAGEYTVIGRK